MYCLLLPKSPSSPLSTQARGLEWEVALTQEDSLPTACVLKPEWIRAVERTYLGPRIGGLPDERWMEVRTALLKVLGLDDIG